MKRSPIAAHQIVALSLLLILMTGLSITTFTFGWIGNLPYHDHLILGTRAAGIHHHAHHGDALDHAQRALQSFLPSLLPQHGEAPSHGIISLQPMTAQPELSAFTAQGWVGTIELPLPTEVAGFVLLAVLILATGRRTAPPSPPPRFA